MFKKLTLLACMFISTTLQSEIVEIYNIDDIRPYIQKNTLCLFDVDDTLIDNPFSLGSPPWRRWAESKIPNTHKNYVLFDALLLYIAKNAHYKTVEPTTMQLISDLQSDGITTFAFTARGRSQWCSTNIEGVDRFTQKQLNLVGIDFMKTQIPPELQSLESTYFYNGIIFAEHTPKGDVLNHLFKDLKYVPTHVIFIDDKLKQVESVEAALKDSGIKFIGFWYRRSELDRANFNPQVANIQLEGILKGIFINDEEAALLSNDLQHIDPHTYLNGIIQNLDLEQLTPSLP